MKTFSSKDEYFCSLLDVPQDLQLYADISNACYIDKLVNPSVDDEGASDILRRARGEGISYWQSRFESSDYKAFVLFEKSGTTAQAIGVAAVVIPTEENDLKCPLMCNAHILSTSRNRGLSHMLIDSCLQYISQCTSYNDVHVLARKGNDASITGLKKRGFFVLQIGEKYTRFLGKIPMICPRPKAAIPAI